MKQLICAKEIEELLEFGKTKLIICPDAIITPAARDLIKYNNIEVVTKNKLETFDKVDFSQFKTAADFLKILYENPSYRNLVIKLLEKKNFEQEKDVTGFTITRGKSVVYNQIQKKNTNILYQDICVGKENVSILEITKSKFIKKILCDEIIYVTSGEISFKINSNEYKAVAGDIVNIPMTVKTVEIKVEDKAKMISVSKEPVWNEKNLLLEVE